MRAAMERLAADAARTDCQYVLAEPRYTALLPATGIPVLPLDELELPAQAPLEEVLQDFQFPQREAAFFYGLFLRGHSAEELRKDIQVPAAVLAKWDRETVREPQLRPILETIVRYRQHVLAIFENLICHDATTQKLQ